MNSEHRNFLDLMVFLECTPSPVSEGVQHRIHRDISWVMWDAFVEHGQEAIGVEHLGVFVQRWVPAYRPKDIGRKKCDIRTGKMSTSIDDPRGYTHQLFAMTTVPAGIKYPRHSMSALHVRTPGRYYPQKLLHAPL